MSHTHITLRNDHNSNLCPTGGFAVVDQHGVLYVRPATKLLPPDEWAYVIAHCLLHLAFGHFQGETHRNWRLWNAACDCIVERFLHEIKFGTALQKGEPIFQRLQLAGMSVKDEQQLYEDLQRSGLPLSYPQRV